MKKLLLSVLAIAASFGLQAQSIPTGGLVARYLFAETDPYSNSSPSYINMWDFNTNLPGISSGVSTTGPDGSSDAIYYNGSQLNIATGTTSPLGTDSYAYAMWVNFAGSYTTGTPTLLRVGESIALQIKYISTNNPQAPTNPNGNTTQGEVGPGERVALTVLHYDADNGWVGFADNIIYDNTSVENLLSSPENWFHLAVVYNGDPVNNTGIMDIYINGAYSFSYNAPHGVIAPNETYPNDTRTIRVGGDISAFGVNGPTVDPNRYFTGGIDDVYIYNTSISATDVSTIYNAGLPNPPVVEWATDSLYICGTNSDEANISVYTAEPGDYNIIWKRDGVEVASYSVAGEQYINYIPTLPGTYYCIINSAFGFVVSPDIIVSALNLFDISIVVNNDNTLGLSAPPTPFSDYNLVIEWYKDGQLLGSGTTIPISGVGTYTAYIGYVGEGAYCENTLSLLYTSMEETVVENAVSMFPNPTSGLVTINSSVAVSAINIYDIAGSLVYNTKVAPGTINLNVDALANGFYTLCLNTNNGVITKKLIKQ